MNVLPWLLDWPPSPAAIAVFVVLTAFSVGTLAMFDGVTDEQTDGNVTVESVDLPVYLNDEVRYPDGGNGTVQKCLASGTPGDSIRVQGDVTVEIPAEATRDRASGDDATVTVSLAHTEENTTDTVEGPGTVSSDVFWVFEDDETLSAGDTATLQVRVRMGDSTVAEATRNVTVQEDTRTYDC